MLGALLRSVRPVERRIVEDMRRSERMEVSDGPRTRIGLPKADAAREMLDASLRSVRPVERHMADDMRIWATGWNVASG